MLNKHYQDLILYFIGFLWLLLLSGVIIFAQNIGFSPAEIYSYYSQKTFEGILKVNLPHIFVFGLLGMVMLHFLVFSEFKVQLKLLTPALYTSAFFELFSPFAIILGIDFFGFIKLLTFGFFIATLFYISLLLIYSIIFD